MNSTIAPPETLLAEAVSSTPSARRRTLAPSGVGAVAVALVLLASLVTSGAALVHHWRSALPGGVVIRLGSTDITVDQFDRRLAVLRALYGIPEPTKAQDRDAFRRDTAKSIAMRLVIERAAAEAGVKVQSSQVQDQVDTLIKDVYGGDRQQFVQMLGQKGVSLRDVTDEIRNQLLSVYLYQRVTAKVPKATQAQAQAFYDQHRAEMVSPERRSIANVVVATEDEAQKVLAQAKRGVAFAALARRYSIDDSTRAKGGRLGSRAQAELEQAYGAVAFAAPPGKPFGPVQTQAGWNVGVVLAVTPSTPQSFESLTTSIQAKLDSDAQMAVWNKFFAGQIREAHVEYAARYRPAHPLTVPSEDQSQPAGVPTTSGGTR